MDWHLIEVGVVTTLSIWVYLFSPSNISRLAAAAMFFLNVIWVVFERERTERVDPAARRRAHPGAAQGDAEQGHEAEGGAPPRDSRVI